MLNLIEISFRDAERVMFDESFGVEILESQG
jgi:hypothetical protein